LIASALQAMPAKRSPDALQALMGLRLRVPPEVMSKKPMASLLAYISWSRRFLRMECEVLLRARREQRTFPPNGL
jgi:hypothetical protein